MLKNNGFHNRHSPFSRPFSPASFFANGEQGWWFDPSNFSTLFQDSAGTTPVTAMEQPVGLQLDLSKGLVLGAELVTNGDFSNGSTGWSAGAGWSIGSGVASFNGTASALSMSPGFSYTAGNWYSFSFTKTGTLAGSLRLSTAVMTFASGQTGTITAIFQAPSTGTSVFFFGDSGTGTVDNVTIKTIAGNHRFQTTSANRPVVSARVNLLTKTEDFDSVVWGKAGATVTANSTNAPNGTLTADTLIETTGGGEHYAFQQIVKTATNITYTKTVNFKNAVGTRNFAIAITDGTTGGYGAIFSTAGSVVSGSFAIGSTSGWTFVSSSVVPAGDGWYQASLTVTSNTSTRLDSVCYLVSGTTTIYTGNGTSGIYIWGADLRPINQGVGLPAYQRVNTSTDYDSVGFPTYIKPNGSNQFMVTNSINFSSTDKMTVWQGVRKLSDAANAIAMELSTNFANGAIQITAPQGAGTPGYQFANRGTAFTTAAATTGYAAPITNVLTAIGDISGDLTTLRLNGTQVAQSTSDLGTGNYGNYPAYFYMRAGTSLPFNGHDYGSIARGAASTAAQITAGETYINSKTKAY
jgi:hypothetical protein